MIEFLDVAARFAAACDHAAIPYFLGGSAATSIYGDPRSTNDLDFVVDAGEAQVPALIEQLGPDFDADPDPLRRAARLRSSWNVFFLPRFIKVDVFFRRDGEYDRVEFARRRSYDIAGFAAPLWVKAPEDSVLRKLCWYRDGGETSDRQWRDIVGTLIRNAGHLDEAHLDTWAPRLGVAELLAKARAVAARL